MREWLRPLAVVFWCGAAVMAFELAGARLLMPVFGMGIDVWARVIAVTLLALGAGYGLGGIVADARPSWGLLAGILLAAGVLLLVTGVVGATVTRACAGLSPALAPWCAVLSTMSLPLVLLGMVYPFLARLLLEDSRRTGRVVGGLMLAGTLGSVAGTLLAGLVAIPGAGVSQSLMIAGGGTVLAGALLLPSIRSAASTAMLAAGLTAGLLTAAPRRGGAEVLAAVESRYGLLTVHRDGGMLSLCCNGIPQTTAPADGIGIRAGDLLRGGDYVELIPYLRPQARTALLIGLGGALHEQSLALYEIRVNAVELDPAVVELAGRYFGLAADVTVGDGRCILDRDDRRYDAIVLDAFVGDSLPEHLYTREAFELARKRLNPGGLLAVHLLGNVAHRGTQAVVRTLEAVFSHTRVYASGHQRPIQNIYVFGSEDPLVVRVPGLATERGFREEAACRVDTTSASILTDDRTNLSLLHRDVAALWRRLSARSGL